MFEMKMARIPDEPDSSAAAPSIIDSVDAAANSTVEAPEDSAPMQITPAPAPSSFAPTTARSTSSSAKRPKHTNSVSGAAAPVPSPSPAAPPAKKKKKKQSSHHLQLNIGPGADAVGNTSASAAYSAASVAAPIATPALLSPAASVSRDSLSGAGAPIPAMSSTDAALIAKLDGDIAVLNAKIRSVQTLQERVRLPF